MTEATGVTFSIALLNCLDGAKIWREGWNGKNQYVVYQKGYPSGIPINENTSKATGIPQGTVCSFLPYLMFKTVENAFVPWVISQTDVLAKDWSVDYNKGESND